MLTQVKIAFSTHNDNKDNDTQLNVHIVNRLSASSSQDIAIGLNLLQGQEFPDPSTKTVVFSTTPLPLASNSIRLQDIVLPVVFINIAAGTDQDADLRAKVKGPTDVLTAELVFESGGDTGWHIHPGPVAVVIKTGSLTEIDSKGCTTVHPAGSAFLEEAGVVHKAVSTEGPSEVFVTFISPKGVQPLIPVDDPGPATCKK